MINFTRVSPRLIWTEFKYLFIYRFLTFQKKTMNVDAFLWAIVYIFLVVTGYLVLQHHRIQCPTFVSACYFLWMRIKDRFD